MDKDVPYLVHEGDMNRMDIINKRLWVIIILLIVLLVGSNFAWLCYEKQFVEVSTVTESYESDASDGGVAIANGDGEVNYG